MKSTPATKQVLTALLVASFLTLGAAVPSHAVETVPEVGNLSEGNEPGQAPEPAAPAPAPEAPEAPEPEASRIPDPSLATPTNETPVQVAPEPEPQNDDALPPKPSAPETMNGLTLQSAVAVESGVDGGVSWTKDSDGLLTFGAGAFDNYSNNSTRTWRAGIPITRIVFTNPEQTILPPYSGSFFFFAFCGRDRGNRTG